jgi:glutathione reductase (NADPH)
LVIGGGSGGVASARRAAAYGAKVALVEYKALGGTCVNVGCVPKKVMFNTAILAEQMQEAGHFGFYRRGPLTGAETGRKEAVTETFGFDWKTIKEARDAYVRRLNGIYATLLRNSTVEVLEGAARFTGPRRVQVGEKEYTADHILIATGGKPVMPKMPGVEHCIHSDGFFALEELPKRVAVVGAGYIAVELAGIFNSLGADTNLFVRYDGPLRPFDQLLRETLMQEMDHAGLHLHKHSTPAGVQKDQKTGKLSVTLTNGQEHKDFDVVLLAIGRSPETESLGVEAGGIATVEKKGYIQADAQQNTSMPGVYALGDVCGKVELTPMAIAAGRRLADRLFGGLDGAQADYANVPTVIFSHPPIGTVGLTEAEAREQYDAKDLKIYTSRFVNLFYGPWPVPPEAKPKTAMKLICVGPEERVVGLHVIGMGADEMLQGFAVALKKGCTKADFDAALAIHPTAAEEFVTLAPWGLSGKKGEKARAKL